MIGILDYGVGNLHSVNNVLKFLKVDSKIIIEKNEIEDLDSLIIPGVGSFKSAMENLEKKDFINPIKSFASSNKPILGICLGMQLLASTGFEPEETKGLGLISGEVKLMKTNNRLPHIGWNSISIQNDNSLLKGVKKKSDFYFVHSYHFDVKNPDFISLKSDYDFEFVSGVKKDNIYGFQFHPEKSQKQGLKILKNFTDL